MQSKPTVSEGLTSWWCGTNLSENATFPMGTMTVDARNRTFALQYKQQPHKEATQSSYLYALGSNSYQYSTRLFDEHTTGRSFQAGFLRGIFFTLSELPQSH